MIARIWRGWVRSEDGDAYAAYMDEVALPGYTATPGLVSASMLRRPDGEREEFCMVTLWNSLDAIKAFAGEEYDRAVFYPDDERFLVEKELTVRHYHVFGHAERR